MSEMRRFRLEGELRSSVTDITVAQERIRRALEDELLKRPEISDSQVDEDSADSLQVVFYIRASSWKEASDLGASAINAALSNAGYELESDTQHRHERSLPESGPLMSLERAGTQLALA